MKIVKWFSYSLSKPIPKVISRVKMRSSEFMVIFILLSFGNVVQVVNENIAGSKTSSSSSSSQNFEIPTSQPGGALRNESFANFLNDARYGRFGVGQGATMSTSTSGSSAGAGGGGAPGANAGGWNFSPHTSRSRIVETKYGKVQGLSITLFPNIHYSGKNNPLKNKIVEVFLGIPYASPPIKSYRFSPTQTPSPWSDVRPAIHPSPVCPQILPDIRNESAALKEMPKGYLEYLRRVEPYLRNQSEDCLYLNVYSSIGPDTKLKPVLVYIHGGKFAWGSGNLSDGTVPSSQADVIYVTLNYRLGILGFLNMNEQGSKPRISNYAIMDQVAALHWIKENIRNFGGNPDNITLLGYESGAACIHFLMSSPAVAPGLFHRAVLIAGSAHAPWALVSDPYTSAMTVAHSLNCTIANSTSLNENPHGTNSATTSTTTTQSSIPHHGMGGSGPSSYSQDPVFECLKSKHFSEFSKFKPPKFSIDFGPSIDGIVIKPNFRSSAKEYQMGKREVSKKYDLLFGISSFEKLTEFSEIDLEFGFESLRRDAILRTLVRNSYRFHRNEILATITNEYIDWERSGQHPVGTRDLTINAVTDCLSLAPVVAASDSSQIKKSFFYVFEHSTRDGLYNYQRAGAGGGEELNYILGYPLVEPATSQVLPFIPSPLPSNYSKSEIGLAELWLTFISNFAHSGDPNGPIKTDAIATWPISKERNRYRNTIWEPYDRLHQKYLEIGLNKIRSRSHYRAHQMAIWLRLVPELQRSGAQIASTFHNRIRGGNDPSLYVGSLKHFPEDDEEEPPELMTGGSSSTSIQLLELPLGYGYYSFGYNNYYGGGGGAGSSSLPNQNGDTVDGLEEGGSGGGLRGRNNNDISSPIFTMCHSPVSSSIQENTNKKGAGNSSDESVSLSSFYLSPYSTVLAITIAIGCSLLLLNIFIFTLVYFRRSGDRSRPKRIKTSNQSLHQDNNGHGQNGGSNKYGEPPELLKSNTTTASSFLHASQSQSQSQLQMELEALELTVKHHQQELMGERAALETDLQLHHHPPEQQQQQQPTHSSNNPQQQMLQQQSRLSLSKSSQNLQQHHQHFQQHPMHYPVGGVDLSSRGILLSPPSSSQSSSINVSSSNTEIMPPQTLAIATLPRCNGSIGGVGVPLAVGPQQPTGAGSYVGIKPMPPPRNANNYGTLPHNMPMNIPPNMNQGQIQLSVDVVTSDEELRV